VTSTHRYTVILELQEERGFSVLVPALPEVVTYGKAEAEALAMAEDAIRLAISYRLDHGEPVPRRPSPRCAKAPWRYEPAAAGAHRQAGDAQGLRRATNRSSLPS
jgi:antitoxin HicB